jgi:hypothetical protein
VSTIRGSNSVYFLPEIMNNHYNIYCDESCHLENDGYGIMVLGAVWCPFSKRREITTRIREIKLRHGLAADFEIKWTKVSPAKKDFYIDVLDYFFDDDDLHFRGILIADKSRLDHSRFNQTHDDWYYKMYFTMLKTILDPKAKYSIYLDIKDTHSGAKERRLLRFLRGHVNDFEANIVKQLQSIRSHESELLQLTDLLIGAIGYLNRGFSSNQGKLDFIKRFQKRSHRSLRTKTLPLENKVNLFIWEAVGAENE